jgi:hypothetical protein
MFKLQDPLTNSESPDELNWPFLDPEQVIGPTAYGTVSTGEAKKKKRYGERLRLYRRGRLWSSLPNVVCWLLTYYSTTASAGLVHQ